MKYFVALLFYLLLLVSTAFGSQSPSISLSQLSIRQGEVLPVKVSANNAKSVWGTFIGKKIKFFQSDGTNRYSALVGADVLAATGVHPLEVFVEDEDGTTSSTIKLLFVQDGKFRKEHLRFGRKSDDEEAVKKRIFEEWTMMQGILESGETKKIWNKEFILPLQSKITSGFGNQRIFNKELNTVHTGVDFRARINTPIMSPNTGKVAFVGNLYYCGKTLLIDHGEGLFSQFCHLYSTKVKTGDDVKIGEIVAFSGNTGRAIGPHLHWAVHVNRARVDPLYVKAHSKFW